MATTRTGRTSPPLLDARSWTEAEDDAVRAAVASHGKRAWTDVARDVSDAFPGRPKTSKQCRARWVASLDPKITTRPSGRGRDYGADPVCDPSPYRTGFP